VSTVGVGGRLFSLAGEGIEDVAAPVDVRLPLHGRLNSVLAKAAYGMVPEVGS
jgi:hypothetical protein